MNRVVNLLWKVVTGFTAVVVVPVPPAVGIAVVTALVVVSEMRFTPILQKSQPFHVKTEEAHAFLLGEAPIPVKTMAIQTIKLTPSQTPNKRQARGNLSVIIPIR